MWLFDFFCDFFTFLWLFDFFCDFFVTFENVYEIFLSDLPLEFAYKLQEGCEKNYYYLLFRIFNQTEQVIQS